MASLEQTDYKINIKCLQLNPSKDWRPFEILSFEEMQNLKRVKKNIW